MLKPRQIEARVKALLQEHGVTRPQVPVEKIARALNAIIRSEPFEGDISGALYRTEGQRPVIGVNALEADVRKRFTVAHEIGHLLLHADALYVDRGHSLGVVPNPTGTKPVPAFLRNHISSQARDPQEIEANRFAASLLMPEHFLARDLRRLGLPIAEDDVRKLAKRYRVSQQAMTFRLMNLGAPMETA